MIKEKRELIQEADLTNNCPVCYNQNLHLKFFQKHTYGKLFHRVTGDISHEIQCRKCDSVIYPVQWTEDIERSFDYYNKLVEPSRKKVRFTTFFYVLIVLLISLVSAVVYIMLQREGVG